MLPARVRQHPDRTAVVDGSRHFSFAAFNARVNQLTVLLRALDITRGDRVAILSEIARTNVRRR
jgi:non-ribosomal peptide synthetase component E (peptide arylation enzyme)